MEPFLIAQFDISFIDISAYFGLAAMGAMVINVALGLLMSVQYSPTRHWPRRRVPLLGLHKWLGYGALFLSLSHPLILLLTHSAKFVFSDILLPINAPGDQPIIFTIGAAALYTLIFVTVTAYFRSRFKYAFWKTLHYAAYLVIIAFSIHGLLANPSLKEEIPIDWLDGGKVFVEICVLTCVAMIVWRITRGRALRRSLMGDQMMTKAKRWRGMLRVDEIVEIGAGVKTIRLSSPDGGNLPFEFQAGQYLSFHLHIDGQNLVRNYTLISAPMERAFCEIAVKQIANGKGSSFLHTDLVLSALIECSGPHGNFVVSGKEIEPVVLIAGGIGITPMISILRNLVEIKWQGEIYLIFAIHSPTHALFREELERIQAQLGQLRVLILPSVIDGVAWPGPSGRITETMISEFVLCISNCRVHLCGPAPMMDAVTVMLKSRGVPRDRIATEFFNVANEPTNTASMVDATVVFSRSHTKYTLPAGQTLLEAADAVAISIDSACRVGTCGTCKVKVLSGAVEMRRDDCLSSQEIRNGVVLACQAIPCSSEIVVEY